MFFNKSKIPTSGLYRISQETFILSLIPVGQVLSEEKTSEKLLTKTMDNDNNRGQVMALWPGELKRSIPLDKSWDTSTQLELHINFQLHRPNEAKYLQSLRRLSTQYYA